MHDDDETANDLARSLYSASDTLTVSVLEQIAGFAANSLIALDHDPDHLARVALARAIAGLRHLTGEAPR